MAKASTTPEPEMSAEERDKRLQKAYTGATQELRDNHRPEFNELYAKHAKEHGVEWKPRLTPEERAAEQFDQLLVDYPHLAERVGR